MTQTFKVGDKVVNDMFGTGEIVYGPYDIPGGSGYFFKGEDGLHRTVTDVYLKPAAKFKVGDKVTEYGINYTIHAGPFFGDTEWYAVEDARGRVLYASPGNFAIVEPANTYTHDGVTYDLAAKYRDAGGDVWSFTGRRLHGVPTVTMSGILGNTDTVEDIADDYGPLTRVND
ncbi:phiSA1p31-related protein [Streptomyces canus]|uniref:phiSA1p31-related protein n=1 Tax=Streptomyces canus TaxID=58343 RepID=UPI0038674E9A|nr:phiSA1p31-related protein [Streptomyces canus]